MDANKILEEASKASQGPANTEILAGIALSLSILHSKVRDLLEPLKEKLREIALKDQDDPVIFSAHNVGGEILGTVNVSFPESSLRISKSTNMEELKNILGEEFHSYFETSVSYSPKKNLRQILTESKTPLSSLVLDSLEVVEGTPRVSFKPSS